MPTRNRLVRVTVELPDARISTIKYYREEDLAALRAPRECVGSDVLDMIQKLQEVTANDLQ